MFQRFLAEHTLSEYSFRSDFLPTVLNLLGVESEYDYIGNDAFDETYEGYALFADGSWIAGNAAYDAGKKQILYLSEDAPKVTVQFRQKMESLVEEYTRINNLILETDYYEE